MRDIHRPPKQPAQRANSKTPPSHSKPPSQKIAQLQDSHHGALHSLQEASADQGRHTTYGIILVTSLCWTSCKASRSRHLRLQHTCIPLSHCASATPGRNLPPDAKRGIQQADSLDAIDALALLKHLLGKYEVPRGVNPP
jgi:hypothetical protein